MIPIPTNFPWKLVGYGAAALAVIGLLAWAYSAVYSAGQADVQAKWDKAVQTAKDAARKDTITLVDDYAARDTNAVQIVEKIRHVPTEKTRTIAVEVARDLPCTRWPDRLLDAANADARNIAAASGHRLEPMPADPPAGER